MATNTVDQSKLVLNAFAAVFQNNLLAADLVTWKQYDSEMNDRNGLKVSEQVGPRYLVNSTTNGVADLTAGVQDSTFGSEEFVVNKTFNTSMGWGDFVKIRDIGDARENTALTNAATQLAEQIDAYILSVAQFAANNEVGTPGNSVKTYDDVLSAYTRLKSHGVDDADLRMVMTYGDKQALGSTILNTYTATQALSTSTYRQGFSGEVAGLPVMFTQQLSALTPGTRTNGTVAGANQNVSYASVAISAAPGQYMTQTLNIAGLGANATIKDGEIFTIGSAGTAVNAWDPRLQQVQEFQQEFRVVGATTADGSGNATVRIFPAIIIGDTNTNSAHRTVDVAPANAAAVTWRGSAGVAYKPRLLIQKQAIVVNTADLITPATDTASRKQLTKVPMSVRMWQHSDFNTGNHSIRFDCALTANVRDRRRLVRLNGS